MAPQILRNLLPALIIVGLAGSTTTADGGTVRNDPMAPIAAAPAAAAAPALVPVPPIPAPRLADEHGNGASFGEPDTASDQTGFEIQIRGADEDRRDQIERALARFDEAGLELPPLVIEVHDSRSGCDGHGGLFRWGGEVARVELCAPETFVIFHELGHAWELTHMTDDERPAVLEAADLAQWDDRSIPWKERGREVAANTIAIGLAYRELSGRDLPQFAAELELYEILTGLPSPRIAE